MTRSRAYAGVLLAAGIAVPLTACLPQAQPSPAVTVTRTATPTYTPPPTTPAAPTPPPAPVTTAPATRAYTPTPTQETSSDLMLLALQLTWDNMSASDQAQMCLYFGMDPKSAYRSVQTGAGNDPALTYSMFSSFMNAQC